ncbi:hypothetical protein WDW89_18570 [Deltaproteobacteria bacterium TL4]
MKFRRLLYEKSVAYQLKELKDAGFGQHVEKIRSNAILIKVHGEELSSLQRIDDSVPLYVLEILGLELDSLDPNEGYLLFVRIDRDAVRVLKISQYTRFFP